MLWADLDHFPPTDGQWNNFWNFFLQKWGLWVILNHLIFILCQKLKLACSKGCTGLNQGKFGAWPRRQKSTPTVSFKKGARLAKEMIGWCKYGPGSTWRIPGLSSEGKAEENATEKWSQEPQRVEGCHLKNGCFQAWESSLFRGWVRFLWIIKNLIG